MVLTNASESQLLNGIIEIAIVQCNLVETILFSAENLGFLMIIHVFNKEIDFT